MIQGLRVLSRLCGKVSIFAKLHKCNGLNNLGKRRILATLGIVSYIGIFLSQQAMAMDVDFERNPSLPIVYINVAIKDGYVSDPQGKEGLTNFMGEMLLRGTEHRTKEQINQDLDQMGAQLDVEIRADSLILRGAVLSSQLEPYLKLLSEILTEPSFPQSEMNKLKSETVSVIQDELGDDSGLAGRGFSKFLFQKHPYGKSALGKIHDVENLKREEIQSHYNQLVRDHLLLVVGTGDASPERISSWTEELVKARPDTKSEMDGAQTLKKVGIPRDSDQRRVLIIDKPDRTQTQINLGQIGVKMTDSDFFPLYVGNYAFGGPSFSSTLMVEIRVKRGWSYGAGSAFRFGLQPRSWHVHLFPAAKDTPDALAYTMKLVDELKEKGITQEQFDFAKRSLVNNAGFMYNTPKKRVENKLLEKTLELPSGFMQSYADHIKDVKLSQVNAALKKFLQPNHLAVVVLGTAKNLKAPLAKSAGVSADQVKVVPYNELE